MFYLADRCCCKLKCLISLLLMETDQGPAAPAPAPNADAPNAPPPEAPQVAPTVPQVPEEASAAADAATVNPPQVRQEASAAADAAAGDQGPPRFVFPVFDIPGYDMKSTFGNLPDDGFFD